MTDSGYITKEMIDQALLECTKQRPPEPIVVPRRWLPGFKKVVEHFGVSEQQAYYLVMTAPMVPDGYASTEFLRDEVLRVFREGCEEGL